MLSAIEVFFRLSDFKISLRFTGVDLLFKPFPILIVFQGGHLPTFTIFKIVVISTLIDLYMLQILLS